MHHKCIIHIYEHLLYICLHVNKSGGTLAEPGYRADGSTAHLGAFGHAYKGEICCFSETVMFKMPLPPNRKQGKKTFGKADTTWFEGLWVGKYHLSDEHLVLMQNGQMKRSAQTNF